MSWTRFLLALVFVSVSACGASHGPVPDSARVQEREPNPAQQLAGTWTGVDASNQALRYVFRPSGEAKIYVDDVDKLPNGRYQIQPSGVPWKIDFYFKFDKDPEESGPLMMIGELLPDGRLKLAASGSVTRRVTGYHANDAQIVLLTKSEMQ